MFFLLSPQRCYNCKFMMCRFSLFFCSIVFLITPMRVQAQMASENYFPKSYEEARTRFGQTLWWLKKQGINFERFEQPLPSLIGDQNLFLDAAYLPSSGSPRKLFILSSGIHGAEAPVGSALQNYFLQGVLPKLDRKHLGILVFHVLNPYGFAHEQRVVESNVDLNRNFVLDEKDFLQKNSDYENYRNLFSNPSGVSNFFGNYSKIAMQFALAAIRGKKSRNSLRHAFAGGQYQDHHGIYYGGKKPEPQVAWVDGILKKILRSKSYSEVLHFDIHSGYGKAGSLQMIAGIKTKGEPLFGGPDIHFVTTETDGFYATTGDFIDFVYDRAAASGARAATYTAEFGTLGDGSLAQIDSAVRIILENRGRQWGYDSPGIETQVKENFRQLFNPSDERWRSHALEIGKNALDKTFQNDFAPKDTKEIRKSSSRSH
jgi:hypothetical protein